MHNSTLVAMVKNGVEESIAQLQTFIRPSVDFCNRPEFREEFCIGYVRIGVVMHFLGHLLESAAVSQLLQPYLSLLKCCISVTHSSFSGLYVFQYPALLVGCISVTSSPVSGCISAMYTFLVLAFSCCHGSTSRSQRPLQQ